MSKRTSASVVDSTPSTLPKRGKAASAPCDECAGCEARAKMLSEKESQLQALQEQLDARQEELAEKAVELSEYQEMLEARERLLDAEREEPALLRRREERLLAKLEERMRLALALNELPRERERGHEEAHEQQRETMRDALTRLGKSYEHYNDGNGVLVAAQLYGSVERFVALFPVGVKLGVVTPVARLLDALAHGKFELKQEEEQEDDNDDDGTEEVEPRNKESVSKSLLRAFGRRVNTRDDMKRVCTWLSERENLSKLTEEELQTLIYGNDNGNDNDNDDVGNDNHEEEQHEPFEPPSPRNIRGNYLSLRNDELYKKIEVAQQLERGLVSKEALEAKHGAYTMRIGKALVDAAWIYHTRGSIGNDGVEFFLTLFSTSTAKRKHADLGTVERTAVLINALDEDTKQRFASVVDLPQQMAQVSALATREAVDLVRCRVVKGDTLRRLARLLDELESTKARNTAVDYLQRHSHGDLPRREATPARVIELLQEQLGGFILSALVELARYEREEHNEKKLYEAVKEFADFVEQLEHESAERNSIMGDDQRDALLIALMLLWNGHNVIKAANADMHMRYVCDSLKKLLGMRSKSIAHPDTGDDQDLFDWPNTTKDGHISEEY